MGWAQPREREAVSVQTTGRRQAEAQGARCLARGTDPGRQKSKGDLEGQERGKGWRARVPLWLPAGHSRSLPEALVPSQTQGCLRQNSKGPEGFFPPV